jgi:epoxyqueuosine reductase
MNKFHSTVSRRDFMKGLGLVGAGLGAASATAPVFHDLDEVMAADSYQKPNMPWWVKERDINNPTVPIDWDMLEPWDLMKGLRMITPDHPLYFDQYATENARKYVQAMNARDPDFDWSDARRIAIDAAAKETGGIKRTSFLGADVSMTPEAKGYPKWTGTPEENFKLLRGAIRFLGGSDLGVIECDDKCKKLGFTGVEFENVNEPYEKPGGFGPFGGPKVIPNSYKWGFVWTLRQAQDLSIRQGGGCMRADADAGNPYGIAESAAVWMAYSHLAIVEQRLQVYLRALGYRGANDFALRGAAGTMTGMVEHARMGSVGVHPEYGATIRGLYNFYTDLPLPPTKPIDAGIYKFCETCGICADACPGGLIQKGEATWESDRPDLRPGYLGWRANIADCPHCPICQSTCPFNVIENGSFMHSVVKGTIANTSLFNGFFTNMDTFFGYDYRPQAEYWDTWWNQPIHGYNTAR